MTNEETIRELEILHYNDCLMPYEVEALDTAISLLKQKPKMGRWIFNEVLDHHYYCSECNEMGVNYWDYCPNCGSYNGGDAE